ncbi:MAG: NAD(P)H-binding protein [Chitinophagaceae bacterium]
MKHFFITGGTGYIGTRFTTQLVKKGYRVSLLVRKGSEHKVPAGANMIVADPFDSTTFQSLIPKGAVFIQLLGVAHPSPKKAKQFREIDLRSVKSSADAASFAEAQHFIYVSVAMASGKIMQVYREVRKEGEEYCLGKKLNCTFIRPWYVLGPGHWWPVLLLPVYGLGEIIPSWRNKVRSMALVTIRQVLDALVDAAESDSKGLRIIEINEIRNIAANKK